MQRRLFLIAVSLALLGVPSAIAQISGGGGSGSSGNDDPIGNGTCTQLNQVGEEWIREQLNRVVAAGQGVADSGKCSKAEAGLTVQTVELPPYEDFFGTYTLMRVHGECQLQGAIVYWKKFPTKTALVPNGSLECGCKISEFKTKEIARLSTRSVLPLESPSAIRTPPPDVVAPQNRIRVLYTALPKLVSGFCSSGGVVCKIYPGTLVWVEEEFSYMSVRLAQTALKYFPGIEIPDPVCELNARRTEPQVPESDICSLDYEKTQSLLLETRRYEYEATVPRSLAWWVHHDFEGVPDFVQMKLCKNSGELLPPPSSNALWTISPTGFDSSTSFGGAANFPIRIPGQETELAVGQ